MSENIDPEAILRELDELERRLDTEEQRAFLAKLMNELRQQGDAYKNTGRREMGNREAFNIYMTGALVMYGLAMALGNTLVGPKNKIFAVPPPEPDHDAIDTELVQALASERVVVEPVHFVGQRVQLVRDVELFPHGIYRVGLTGTIMTAMESTDRYWVKLDEHFAALNDWDNEIEVSADDIVEEEKPHTVTITVLPGVI